MKLSLKVEYACRVLAQLARHHCGGGQLCQIDTLAASEALPASYLVQILNELRTGGVIISRRGKQGGYALARPPADITLYDVIAILDSEMLHGGPAKAGESGPRVAAVWGEISEVLEGRLRAYTVESLVAAKQAPMYYI